MPTSLPEALLHPPADVGEGAISYLQLAVPVELRDAVLRHHDHLVQLSTALRDAGLPEEAICARIDAAVASYRNALVTSLQSLRQS